MVVRPQKRTVSIVDEAIAVRADNRHLAGCGNEFSLQPLTILVISAAL
ncbi:hypothetical protein X744_32115 [Mesorhizobium sp. LNJC372A00]|nr:hypothetical protein X744_32115 [Mesorhizobium sp. LNJC372A00]